eukprot:6237842-Amphidinium_carterae.1
MFGLHNTERKRFSDVRFNMKGDRAPHMGFGQLSYQEQQLVKTYEALYEGPPCLERTGNTNGSERQWKPASCNLFYKLEPPKGHYQATICEGIVRERS